MIFVQQRIAKLVVFIGKLDGGRFKHKAFVHTIAFGKGTSSNVADDDLKRDDVNSLDEGFTVTQLPDKVRGDTGFFKALHQQVAHPVVDDAFAVYRSLFETIECCRIILVGNDEEFRVLCGIDFFCFSFIKLLFPDHI